MLGTVTQISLYPIQLECQELNIHRHLVHVYDHHVKKNANITRSK